MTNQSESRLPSSMAWLNATQFLGAFNDNIFKLLAIFFLNKAGDAPTSTVVSTVGAVFVVPYLLVSHVGGALADRFSKRTVIVWTKVAEIAVMSLACIALTAGSRIGLYACCFLMAAQSALFSPAKYGIVPEIVARDGVARANGLLACLTFLAIVAGTPAAAALSTLTHGRYDRSALFCIAVAVLGTVTSLFIRHTPAAGARRGVSPVFVREILETLHDARRDSYLFMAIVSSGYFLMLAAFMQLNIIPYGMETLRLSQENSSYLFLLAAVGVGISAVLAGRLSGRNIEFGLLPVGAACLAVGCIALFATSRLATALVATFVCGMSAGFFTVPLDAFLQVRSPRRELGRILAASNFIGSVGVLAAAGLIYLISTVFGRSAADGFLIAGFLTLILTVAAVLVLPDFLARFLMSMITRTIYRIDTTGLENLPTEGGALLVSNHVTWADALLILATQQRRIRFVMARHTYEESRLLKPILKLLRVIPVSESDPPRKMLAALKEARGALDNGFMVCVFAEGALTRTGNLQDFKPGFERVVRRSNYPVIPVYIGGAWGSIFSYKHGKPMSILPRRVPYPVSVMFGEPMPPDSTAFQVRQAVCELATKWSNERKRHCRPLAELFVKSARRQWTRKAISDTTGRHLSFGKALTAAVALADKLRPICGDREHVGILLPTTAGAALANVAVGIMGKVAVNLNFTASREAIASAIRQSDIATIISSKKFIERLKDFKPPEGMIFLEDIMPTITTGRKLAALLKAAFLPARMLVNSKNFSPDAKAAIIFSSGTTGEPKGVMLSHHNISSNIESFATALRITDEDRMCAALPFFHSFGYTCTLWFPLTSGFAVCYHPDPMQADKIAEVVRTHKSSILLATPTFLMAYTRKAEHDDFSSLRYVITGAEKLRQRVAESFEKKFGFAPLEGYGVTETAPVVSLNLPDLHLGGIFQRGTKKGSIGLPIPGVAVKIVDTTTGEDLPPGQEGLLLVKGPNVMLGYLNQPEKTADAIKMGWYNTGDIARMDPDGFITITDRASRFSKIGGEMVPHMAIEDAFLKKLHAEGHVLAVTSVADDRRGERLIVLHTKEAGTGEALRQIMKESDLPNLWKPRSEDFFLVDAIPITGSGKLDLKSVKELAKKLSLD